MCGRVLNWVNGHNDFSSAFDSVKGDYFPEDKTWWFGWHACRLELPRRLEPKDQDQDVISHTPWEHLRVFSTEAELRLILRANEPTFVLLTESQHLNVSGWHVIGEYDVRETKRILLGEPPKGANGPNNELIEIAYPRSFNYGLNVPLNHHVIVQVKSYLDKESRQCYSRYCGLYHSDVRKLEVQADATL